MKKLISLGLLVLLVAISPYFIGQQAEIEVRNIYSKISDSTGYELEVTEYHRGWLHSNATVVVKVPVPAEYDTGIEYLTFTSLQQIQHGPILFKTDGLGLGVADIEYQINLPEQLTAVLPNELAIPENTLQIMSRLAFNGDINSTTHLKAFDLTIDNALLSVKEAKFSSSIGMTGAMTVTGNWQGFTVSEDNINVLSITDIDLASKQQVIRGEVFSQYALSTGDVLIDIAEMKIYDLTTATQMSNSNSKIKIVSSEHNDLLTIDALISSNKIQVIDNQYNDFNYQVTLANLDIDVFQEMQKIMVQAQELPEQERMMAFMQIQSLLPKMIAKDPEFIIKKLGLNTANGAIASAMNFSIDQTIYDPQNPMSLIMAVNAQAQGEAPKAFFNEIGKADDLNEYIAQGLLIEENENVMFEFSFVNGQALLNGMPIPLG